MHGVRESTLGREITPRGHQQVSCPTTKIAHCGYSVLKVSSLRTESKEVQGSWKLKSNVCRERCSRFLDGNLDMLSFIDREACHEA